MQEEPLRLGGWYQRLFAAAMARGGRGHETLVAARKAALLAGLTGDVLEIGPGSGPNLAYYAPTIRWVGVEPNPYMHPYLRRSAARQGLAVELRPPTLDHLGLVAALEQLFDQVNREKLFEVQFEVVGQAPHDLDPQVKTALYRIAQEALMNIRRHAQATQADIILKAHPQRLTLVIEDNGVGFNPVEGMHTGRWG